MVLCDLFKDLGLAPMVTLLAGIFFINLIVVYLMAVIKGDVDPFLPYISEAADKRPQSCVFAIFTNISSIILLLIVFARYRQVRGMAHSQNDEKLYYYNKKTKWFGYLACVGMFLVANVQDTAAIDVHMTSAAITFGSFNVYMITQCYITYRTTPELTTAGLLYYRMMCAFTSLTAFILAITFGYTASSLFHHTYPDLPTPRPWNRKIYQPGYEFHQASAVCEWICAIGQIFFIQSFGPEFEDMTLLYYFRSLYIVHAPEEHEAWDEDEQQHGF